jgi:3-methylcrotonyl-CoA carboxylase beta subunit
LVDTSSPEFIENAKQMATAIASLKGLHANIERGGPEKARDKHLARGKMLPRE